MDLKKAIEILKHFNEWRRGNIEEIIYTPTEIGIAIDYVLIKIENLDE